MGLFAYLTRWPGVVSFLWRVAALAGAARRWLTSGWRRIALWVALAGALLYGFDRWVTSLSWLSFWSGLAVVVIAAFAVAVWRARARVVIEPFIDYNKAATATESSGDPPVAPGLNDALVSELAALRELYRAVGERAEVDPALGSAGGKPVDATLELQDVSEFLQNASTGDAKVSVGPFALPIGTVLAMLGRLAQGPRVAGGLQLVSTPDGDGANPAGEVVLTAYYVGPGRHASWSVREPLPDYAASKVQAEEVKSFTQTAAVRGMVQELAARMFADLALEGTRSWRATRRFLEGLRQYRLAHESQQDKVLKLRRAERAFIEALADDVDMPLARYNLGVVYRELHQEAPDEDFGRAAENAFRRELQREQPSWQPYYALAVISFAEERHADVSSLCDRVIELADGPARKAIAYDLKGLADRRREGSLLGLEKAIESRRRAVAYAFLALCSAELKSGDQKQARGLAARCTHDLGIALAFRGRAEAEVAPDGAAPRKRALDACRRLLSAAARLEDAFAPRYELGTIAFEFGDRELAVQELRAAARIDPTSAPCWAWLAKVNASLLADAATTESADEWRKRSYDAMRLARANLDLSLRDEAVVATEQLAEALDYLGDPDSAELARQIPWVGGTLEAESDVAALEARFADETDKWTRGQIAYRIAAIQRAARAHPESADWYKRALVELSDDYGSEVRRLGLQGMVALALASQDPPQAQLLREALSEAHAAISVDPLRSWERETLGRVHETIGDLESAIAAYEYALFWLPNSPRLHTLLGNAYSRLADESSNAARRKKTHALAIAHLESALVLQPQSDLAGRAAAHFALGRGHTSADAFERAVPHYRNALASVEAQPLVRVYLAEAYVRMKRYADSEEVIAKAIEGAEAVASGDPRTSIGDPVDEPWYAADLAAQAHRLLALSFIERDVRLDEAREHVQASERLLDQLGDEARADARASGRELEGRILLEEGQYDTAIASLNESVGLSADVEAYLHLARAYRTKASSSRAGKERDRALQLAKRACRHAQDLDTTSMYQPRIGIVLAELESMSLAPAAT